jgi:hypothetical protein
MALAVAVAVDVTYRILLSPDNSRARDWSAAGDTLYTSHHPPTTQVCQYFFFQRLDDSPAGSLAPKANEIWC